MAIHVHVHVHVVWLTKFGREWCQSPGLDCLLKNKLAEILALEAVTGIEAFMIKHTLTYMYILCSSS